LSDHAKLAAASGAKPSVSSNQFTVRVADNFHMYDEDDGEALGDVRGSYATYAEAVRVAAQIVCDSLLHLAKPGMDGAELLGLYKDFGEDPFIVGAGPCDPPFSGWRYAKHLCEALRARSRV
jgi:hypothetical protein